MHPCPCRCADIGAGARLAASRGPASPAALPGHFPPTCYPTRGRSGTAIGRDGLPKPERACCPAAYPCGAGTGTMRSERFAGTLGGIAAPTTSRLYLIRTSPTAFRQSRVRGRVGECPWTRLSAAQKGFMASQASRVENFRVRNRSRKTSVARPMRHRIFPGMSDNRAVAALPTSFGVKRNTTALPGHARPSASVPSLGPRARSDESPCRYGFAGSQTAMGPIPRFDQE